MVFSRGSSFFKLGMLSIMMLMIISLKSAYAQLDLSNEILESLRSGQAKNISKHFNTNVSLSLKNDAGFYSKFQGEMILSDFFRSNRISEVKLIQRTNKSNNSYYMVCQLKANHKGYRVFVKFNILDGESKITELRIE
ncbi:DUF4783 domain-containing protein [Sphingobacterium sp. HJSM2_6]|uniref:DUF4783 domain-containing protein n=1 Tax=Sphingobacterium sp. HJSM2_6 TaxID=3366264 RepID=UPI003BDF2234